MIRHWSAAAKLPPWYSGNTAAAWLPHSKGNQRILVVVGRLARHAVRRLFVKSKCYGAPRA